jgi:hydantoinase/carbamoylase family amidase
VTGVRPERALADLRELDRLSGGPEGARRVCWTPEWERARAFLRERLAEIEGVTVEQDEAGNLWARLPGELDETVAFGSHIDSVPNGGWLDGALGVMAGVEVLRAAAEAGTPRHSLALIDFADEEGARFGRSLFGSSAVAGTLDPEAVSGLTDADGRTMAEVLAEHGVELARAPEAARGRTGLVAYLELHIEQGPVLESEGVAVAAVTGTFGVERHRFTFTGQASHAGTTPMDMRRDAGLAAARTALEVERIAREHGGVGTTGVLRLTPGIATAVPGRAAAAGSPAARSTTRPRWLVTCQPRCCSRARRTGSATPPRRTRQRITSSSRSRRSAGSPRARSRARAPRAGSSARGHSPRAGCPRRRSCARCSRASPP